MTVKHLSTPFDYMAAGMEMGLMALEAQSVVTMRVMGMAGFWSVSPSETTRMVTEKGPAFMEAANAATSAMMRGETPDKVVSAAVKPLRQRTRSNSQRLAKRGAKLP